MRKYVHLYAAFVMLLMTVVWTGCSSASPSHSGVTPVASGNEVSSSEHTNATAQTRTVSTIKGDVVIPAHPQRIVVDLYLGSLIALEVKPVGTPELNLKNPYFTKALAGVENIGEYEQISLEKIMELQPDTIITGNAEAYEQFSKIAPTILVPFGELKDTHEEVTYFGKVLGKETEAKAWLEKYDRRVAELKERVNQAVPKEATFSIMEDWGKSTGVFGDNFGRGGQAIYRALGLHPPAKKAKEIMEQQSMEVSQEVLPDFAGDYIILSSETITMEDLKADPVWKTLDAVKQDRVYIWKHEKSWYFDPIATLSQTEELAAWITSISEK
ncbi:ABC transporter substrate-binding protein [Paenibacillus sp. ACRRX]|uniref:ABC transporter substrate-binding protein n=1 Tax=unclassified Paenibacillus TaxID=185978 RepID=UPI001EF50251|nr:MULTISPECIES: ABC transporter substrate-binding protein [unclassified Paenibacillus]MCG7406156.1 ABC transporter substrate-binding protein [Paenibacillus sp. ACRRX]MDK8182611.1 ABC transporter substrate-binding protein [Paenibacillus sp. UMB4589-SE434]